MKKKFIFKLLLLVVLCISLYSCVHDEVTASFDPSSKEYTNKSLWKEDEKYIKNVMKVYQENESKIKKGSGTPYWDYATTMDSFDESFLMVPVVDNGKVISVLQVPRHGTKIYFIYRQSQNDISFFQNYISARVKKAINTNTNNSSKGTLVCSTKTISTWYPNNESNPDPEGGDGYWVSSNVTTCRVIDAPIEISDCLGIVDPVTGLCDMGNGGGGTGYPYPNTPDTPCDKTRSNLAKPQVLEKINELRKQAPKGGELGVMFKADGTPSATITGETHSVNFRNKTGYVGGYHNHTPTGIPMLSPPDIDQLLGFARAQPTSNPANANNAYLGMVAPNGMHYVIWFNGGYQDAVKTFTQDDLDNFTVDFQRTESNLTDWAKNGTKYIDSKGDLNNLGAETLFFETLSNMGLAGKLNLQRIEKDGTINNITLNSTNQPTPVPCS
ncbi:hypothetical protein [Chryseobacterium proteolyticum]|uniref:hypothetical protein n=1 Tax=Chryseobacterium proteolyticum TaxID=118127 RepID=UPI0039839B0F